MYKYLTKGQQGYIFSPGIPCKNSSKKFSPNTIGKIFTKKENFDREKNGYEIMKKYVPKHIPKVYAMCEVDNIILSKIPGSKCPKNTKQKYEIVYQKEGISLYDFLKQHEKDKTKINTKLLLTEFLKILKVLQSLIKKGFSHPDLHDKNILIDPKTYKMKMIDFVNVDKIKGTFIRSDIGAETIYAILNDIAFIAQKLKKINKDPKIYGELDTLFWKYFGDTTDIGLIINDLGKIIKKL